MPIPQAINMSINLDMIDKNQIVQGKKGRYINVRLVNTPDNQYGYDYFAAQDIPKEMREQGLRGPILGNARAFGIDQGQPAEKGAPAEVNVHPRTSDDLPF